VDRIHDGKLEMELVDKNHTDRIAAKQELFSPGDPVYVIPTLWTGEWCAFAACGDKQPGPVATDTVSPPT